MADEKVGIKTGKSTQAGRDVYKTEDGENVSEKSTTFKYKGQWINVPSIHNGYQYDNDTLSMMLDAEVIAPTSTHKSESDAVKAAVERSKSIAANFNKGGTPMQRQMELFRDGGLKDEGGMIDEESGNEVPIGGTKEGVRDDIPANVSEGEFVMPADVVRYHGLDKMMQIRQEAKMGLKKMEAMGQMGNSDEATMDDDMPFGMADLIVVGDNDEPMEFADGGFVPSRNYAPGGLTTGATGSGRVGQPVDVEPTAPVIPVDQPSTRRLTPEVATAPVTKIDFKKLMGEAAIEYKEYRNAAGESIMISFIGGQPAYPIPDGYSLYTGDGAVGSGTAGGTADGIAYAANTATAEYRQSNNDNDDPFKDMPVAKAIDWASLSTEELMAESAKLTGVSSTIAKGAMAFMGPFGAIGYAMMRHQDKKVAQEIANRIAKGGLTAAQLKTLTAAQEKLTPKGFTLIGKIIETVGNALGFGKDVVEATKKNAVSIENKTTSRSPALSGDRLIATMKEEQIQAEAELQQARALEKQIQAETDMSLDIFGPNPTAPLAGGNPPIGSQEFEGELTEPMYATSTANMARDFAKDGTDYEEKKYGLSPPGSKLTSEESIAKRKDAASTYTPPSYDPIVRTPTPGLTDDDMGLPTSAVPAPTAIDGPFAGFPSASVDVQTDSAFGMPREDFGAGVPETRFTAPVAPAYEPLEDYVAPSTQPLMSIKNVPKFIQRAGEESRSLIYDTPISAIQAQELGYSTEQPVRPTIDVVPPSPVLNIDNRPSGDSRDYQGGSYGYGQTGVAPVAAAPVPAAPSDVGTQTQQAFAPYDAERMMKINEIPTAPKPAAPYDAERMMKINEIPTTTPTAQTFKQAFAANRAAGAKTFDYNGKSYTTQTAEEAAPKGSNSFFQSAANLFTPGDGKEYVDGKIVTTGSSSRNKSSTKSPSVSSLNMVAKTDAQGRTQLPRGVAMASGTGLNNVKDPVVIVNGIAYNKSKAPKAGSSKTSSGSSTKTYSSLAAAAKDGQLGKAVNIQGKGVQKVAFADKAYEANLVKQSNNNSKSSSSTTSTKSSSGGGGFWSGVKSFFGG